MFLAVFFPLIVHAQKGEKIQTIVIDAGHGGKDPGALGKSCKEKDINLSVALKLGAYIEENMPSVKVVYTRKKDVFVELNERAAIANRNDADVFISIHCNSAANSSVNGAETFVMGESKNEANLNVAKAENAAILLEDNANEAYDNFDPNSTEAYILFSLSQSLNQSQSLQLADKVQQHTLETYEIPRPDSDVHDYYRNFIAATRGEATQIVTHAQMRRVLKVMEAAFLSDEAKAVIPFKE